MGGGGKKVWAYEADPPVWDHVLKSAQLPNLFLLSREGRMPKNTMEFHDDLGLKPLTDADYELMKLTDSDIERYLKPLTDVDYDLMKLTESDIERCLKPLTDVDYNPMTLAITKSGLDAHSENRQQLPRQRSIRGVRQRLTMAKSYKPAAIEYI